MGSTLSGCIRSKTQQVTPAVMVTHLGSGSESNRCLPTGLEDRRIVSVPAMETDSTCLETNKGTEVETSSISNTIMAKPVLDPNDSEDETHCISNNLEIEQKMDISRMAVINNYRITHGLNNTILQFLNQKIRLSTQKIYDQGWTRWTTWSTDNHKKALEYNPHVVLEFLVAHQHYSSNHLSTLRPAMVSVFAVIHEQQTPIADQLLIKEFFEAKRKSKVTIPKKSQLFTWDITILIKYTKDHLTPTMTLFLQQLQLKTILLLCMATMWRPRSDIGRLQFRDIHVLEQGQTTSETIHARQPKAG